jgi:hypothetical protein
MCITVVMDSYDFTFGFRNFAPELFPEFDHVRELDYVWFRVRCDVAFVPFRILV